MTMTDADRARAIDLVAKLRGYQEAVAAFSDADRRRDPEAHQHARIMLSTHAVAGLPMLLVAAESAFTTPPMVAESGKVIQADRSTKLTMPNGDVLECEYPNGSDWAASWSIQYADTGQIGTTSEQDWELVAHYGLTAILDALRALPASQGAREGDLPKCIGVSRVFDNEKALLVSFRSKPSDDDLRAVHDLLGEG